MLISLNRFHAIVMNIAVCRFVAATESHTAVNVILELTVVNKQLT